MGAYRKFHKLPGGVSIASDFDDRVDAARAAADEGEFDFCIAAQGGANVKRDDLTVRVARTTTEEINEYEEDIERVVSIYTRHLGAGHIRITCSSEWRIVPKTVAAEPLTLKSGIAEPWSSVNNCGVDAVSNEAEMGFSACQLNKVILNIIDKNSGREGDIKMHGR